MSKTHSLYAAYFSDGRIKIGVTADVPKRMSYYAQEARRNRVSSLTWWSCAPIEHGTALLIEKSMCRHMREYAMPRHREWFEGTSTDFQAFISGLERFRVSAADSDESPEDLPFMGSYGHVMTEARA